jgi:hypothetical protein
MNLEIIETRFSAFLEKFWRLSDITPFLLVYIQLLLLYKDELSPAELSVVLQRKKQLIGERFVDDGFDEIRRLSRKELNKDLGYDVSATQRTMLNELLFCALLDSEEDDFFYLTEPIFEFARGMNISHVQLAHILESEFSGFKVQ